MTLADATPMPALLPRLLAGRGRAWRVAVVLAGSWLLAAASWASAPMYPTPMTLQTLAVFVIAGLAGPRLSFEVVLIWLLQAAIGLPVLAGGASGIEALTGPTAGYLAGLLAAAPLCAWLAARPLGRSVLSLTVIFILGHALVLAAGFGWLAGKIGAAQAFTGGVAPFPLGALAKSAAAAFIVNLAQARLPAAERS